MRVDRPSAPRSPSGRTATIGTFTKSENGYTGSVRTLTVNAKARITAAEKEKDNAPDYRVFAGTADYAERGIMRNGAAGMTVLAALGVVSLHIISPPHIAAP